MNTKTIYHVYFKVVLEGESTEAMYVNRDIIKALTFTYGEKESTSIDMRENIIECAMNLDQANIGRIHKILRYLYGFDTVEFKGTPRE